MCTPRGVSRIHFTLHSLHHSSSYRHMHVCDSTSPPPSSSSSLLSSSSSIADMSIRELGRDLNSTRLPSPTMTSQTTSAPLLVSYDALCSPLLSSRPSDCQAFLSPTLWLFFHLRLSPSHPSISYDTFQCVVFLALSHLLFLPADIGILHILLFIHTFPESLC